MYAKSSYQEIGVIHTDLPDASGYFPRFIFSLRSIEIESLPLRVHKTIQCGKQDT